MSNRTLAMLKRDEQHSTQLHQRHQSPIPIVASVDGHAQAVIVIVRREAELGCTVLPLARGSDGAVEQQLALDAQCAA